MFSNLPSRSGKLLAIVIEFFAIGFLAISYFLGVGFCDDRTPLVGNHPMAAESAASTSSPDANTPLTMQIRFTLRHQGALARLLAEQQNPASPNYRKWLKTGEFFHRFGPTKPEVKAVTAWLTGEGFTVTNLAAGDVKFSGSIDQAQRTFAVKIARVGAGNAFGNTSDPFVPSQFANVIGAVTGMDNMVHAMPVSQFTNSAIAPNSVINGSQAFGPNDFQSFYDESTGPGKDGAGDCIAVVGVSDFVDSTMSAFTSQFNLPPISYTREIHGSNPGINGAEVEAELDLQWSHATAPGASIVYHLGGYLVDDITGAVNDNQCGAISISYGFCGPSPAFINTIIDPLFQQAAAQGQSVFVSAGDQGAAGLGYNPNTNSCMVNSTPSVNEMSADPNVTSVGGTQFTPKYVSGSDQGYVEERAWNDVSGASGGGASQIFAKPAYQTGAGVPSDGMRDVPDVSMMASPNAPGALFGHDVSGTGEVICCIGGTSLSAPLWAGFSRVIAEQAGNTRLGNLNTIIYQLANQKYSTAGFHDVTTGNNGYNGLPGFAAQPQYDQASGWGTIDFNVFAAAVTNLLNPSTATPTPTATKTPTPTATATPTPTPTPQPTQGILSAPATLTFPTTATGRPGTMKSLAIRNLSRTSALSVQVSALVAPFAVSGAGSYSIAPQASISIGIFFSPTTSGTATQSLQIVSGDPKHPKIAVQVTASVKGGKLSMPSAVSLKAPMSAMATKTVMLRNSGGGILAGTVQAFGPNAAFTLLGGAVSFSLAPGQSQQVTIEFKPESAGTVQESLEVAMTEPAGSASANVSGSTN